MYQPTFKEQKIKKMPEKIIRCKCRNWLCKKCKVSRGKLVRKVLHQKTNFNDLCIMLTITINPKLIKNPEKAYEYVTKNKFISRLMGLLGVTAYFSVLEFQKNGFPHWHIVCNAYLDNKKVKKFLKKWGLGKIYKITKTKTSNKAHAINYVTKYLIKYPDSGFPEWVMNRRKKIRFINTSRSIGSIYALVTEKKEYQKTGKKRKPKNITYRQRIDACGTIFLIQEFENGKYKPYQLPAHLVYNECNYDIDCGYVTWRNPKMSLDVFLYKYKKEIEIYKKNRLNKFLGLAKMKC